MNRLFNLSAQAYMKYRNGLDKTAELLASKKGSPTVEYVIIIGVGAAVAGLLATALKEDNGNIVEKLGDAVEEVIDKATTLKEEE